MGKKYLQRAAGEGRVAILPEFLQEGRAVWYWRETLCDDELCLDMVGPTCPMNRLNEHIGPHDPEAIRCAMMHPVLDSMEIWHVTAAFTPRGIVWCLNDAVEISDVWLRRSVFPSKVLALANRPEVIAYG